MAMFLPYCWWPNFASATRPYLLLREPAFGKTRSYSTVISFEATFTSCNALGPPITNRLGVSLDLAHARISLTLCSRVLLDSALCFDTDADDGRIESDEAGTAWLADDDGLGLALVDRP
ncbi:hypothetical protein OGATHE_000328 [Ogataea polymorpha]|uniref:Uncharacterized protein n=1 Tax=Ogataea polymorpha TaxID=460523 RepID=A0A9P8TG99_9ASCO|nr:hypothetical protein OGATHE_000328 [Ogataea polymorpha]